MGTHKRYKGVSLNVFDAPTEQFANTLKGHDVVIWYPPWLSPYSKSLLLGKPFAKSSAGRFVESLSSGGKIYLGREVG